MNSVQMYDCAMSTTTADAIGTLSDLELRAVLDEASTYTEQYGDSNPHTNIHRTTQTCDNCHEDNAEMTVK